MGLRSLQEPMLRKRRSREKLQRKEKKERSLRGGARLGNRARRSGESTRMQTMRCTEHGAPSVWRGGAKARTINAKRPKSAKMTLEDRGFTATSCT